MEYLMRPEQLETDLGSLASVPHFLNVAARENMNIFKLLTNVVSLKVYKTIPKCTTYNNAINTVQ
ncbi:hypothetical protein E2C01_037695 [Portunus trituberculatus]|uniref:Uncharacterized protein n=1 Tax=Portunus trituberculatus TaxID=210409 RepID=A0A5B7FES7_PORTR|nr:hypothetical protein [Portunus trituberculatus]